jgi:predicted RNA-binding Zn ribbon-like protein
MVQGVQALFVADSLALDFLNTMAGPMNDMVDCLGTGEGLLGWIEQAKLLPKGVLETMRHENSVEALDRVAGEARALRAWFGPFVHSHKGSALTLNDLETASPLNQLLSRDDTYSMLVANEDAGDSPLRLRSVRRCNSPQSLLMAIGEVLAKFLCEETFADVRLCEGPGCTLLFADHTRGRVRRWCSMGMCGNRAKQAAHRSRSKSQT